MNKIYAQGKSIACRDSPHTSFFPDLFCLVENALPADGELAYATDENGYVYMVGFDWDLELNARFDDLIDPEQIESVTIGDTVIAFD